MLFFEGYFTYLLSFVPITPTPSPDYAPSPQSHTLTGPGAQQQLLFAPGEYKGYATNITGL